MLILLYYHIFFFATKVYYVTLSHLVCFMYNVLRICKMKPLFFHIISIMYVFVFYVFFSSPYCALYLFIVYVIQVNDLSIVLKVRSVPEKLFSLIIEIGRRKYVQLCIFTR